MRFLSEKILSLLSLTNSPGVSDLHIVSGAKICIRKDGKLTHLNQECDRFMLDGIISELLDGEQRDEFLLNKELDFAVQSENLGRFRINCYFTDGQNPALAIRKIPTKIPTLDELNTPKILKDLLDRQKGLILVTGSTGSGKSTLLAAMLNEINLTSHKHIVTIEDPVEFVHKSQNSLFSHRNLKSDTKSYENALKYALRQDPDVILIGEMRDAATIQAAVTAAETGHLVFATLHTNSAYQSINRIIDSFEGSEQNQIRNMLASSLTAIISQSLIPSVDGARVAVREILINNYAIANLIRENKTHQILSQMQMGQAQTAMQTQTDELLGLVKNGVISREVAISFSNNQQEILNLIGK